MKKFKILVLCFLVFLLTAPVLTTRAAENYDIIFRAGGHGILDGGDGKKVVYNVPYGEKIPAAPVVEPEDGYFFKGWSESIKSSDIVTEKKIYIAKYLPIVSGLEYSVKYVDTNGNELATPKMAMGEKESKITEEALVIGGYTVDAGEKALTLKQGSTELVFIYTADKPETPPTEPPAQQTEPQTQPETNTPPTQAPDNNAGNTPTAPPVNNTPVQNDNNEAGNAPDAVTPNDGQEDQGTVNIEDGQVPLGDTPNGNAAGTEGETETFETENITDEEVPLAQKPETGGADNFMLYIAMFAIIVVAGGAGIRYAVIRRRR